MEQTQTQQTQQTINNAIRYFYEYRANALRSKNKNRCYRCKRGNNPATFTIQSTLRLPHEDEQAQAQQAQEKDLLPWQKAAYGVRHFIGKCGNRNNPCFEIDFIYANRMDFTLWIHYSTKK
jgi:hypothetical protein